MKIAEERDEARTEGRNEERTATALEMLRANEPMEKNHQIFPFPPGMH